MSDWKHVKFHPWVGKQYENSRFGMRVLVLGESHYKYEPGLGGKMKDLPQGFTQEIIRKQGGTHYFYKKIPPLFAPAELSDEAGKGPWQHLAFYNYIQEALEDWKQAPTPAQ
jgi:hypothetical protein